MRSSYTSRGFQIPDVDSEIHNLIDRLQEVGSKMPKVPGVYPLEEPVFGTGVSEDDIASLESLLQAPLAEDFLLFQELCGSISAMDIWNGYDLMGACHIKALITNPDSPQVIQVKHGQSLMIPIGGDGGGNLFLMESRGCSSVSK
jgi:hypothetical protein